MAINVICFCKEGGNPGQLTPTENKIKGGHRGNKERVIYSGCDKNWCIKTDNIFNEYLGYAASRLLGLNVPDFGIGADEKSIFFVQEFLPIESPPENNNENLLVQRTNIVAISTLLGDSDVNGMNTDNIIFYGEKFYKIDCGQTFRNLVAPGAISTQLLKAGKPVKSALKDRSIDWLSFNTEFTKIHTEYETALLKHSNVEQTKTKVNDLGLGRLKNLKDIATAIQVEYELFLELCDES